MKILYIQCNMGCAGDMLMASLLELHKNPDDFITKLNNLNIKGVNVTKHLASKCGITGTGVDVIINGEQELQQDHNHSHDHAYHHDHEHTHDHHHEHTHHHEHGHAHNHSHHEHIGFNDIKQLIDGVSVSQDVKANVLAVYNLIAQAESKAHNKPVEQVHFHEVGMIDAFVDILGVSMLIEELKVDKIIASPINVGFGSVKCAHGILPVPAPATAHILLDIPTYSGNIQGELCTPTGAALLKHYANEFANQPIMKTTAVGYGMGKKDFEQANCVRTFLGETSESNTDKVAQISCNIDDMTGEQIGYAQSVLFENGALDVYLVPIQMKKNRPAVMINCICQVKDIEKFSVLMLKHTSSFGVRAAVLDRFILERNYIEKETNLGTIKLKEGKGYGITKQKPEFEEISKLAKENDMPVSKIIDQL